MRCGAFQRVEGTLCLVRHGQAALSGSKTKAPGFAGGYLLNNLDTAGVQSFNAFGSNDRLVTAGSALDLSHTTISGFAVVSTNGLGTIFTVADLGTAFQITGGPGHDTIETSAVTFTADQRNAIFVTASIKTIIDPRGTYTAPPPSL